MTCDRQPLAPHDPTAIDTRSVRVEVQRPSERDASVLVTGDLDLASVPQLAGVVDEQLATGVRRLTLDLSGVTFVDGSTLGLLVHVHDRLLAAGGRLVLAGVGPAAGRLLRITGLDAVFSVTGPAADGDDRPV